MRVETIEELLADFVTRREAGEEISIEAFAAEHFGREEELRRALAALTEVEDLFPCTNWEGAADEPPRRIGPWNVLGSLGRGGMGHVYRVEHVDEPGVERALKQLHPLAAANPRTVERFRREGSVLQEIDHEGIVGVIAVEAAAVPPYLVMESVEGTPLSRLLEGARSEGRGLELPGEGPMHLRAARIVAALARAVHAAHERGLLHRDLKPSNVILRSDGRPVLIDFGLAVHEESATLTESGDLLGTPHYMAPEQALGRRAEVRTDVYGLGAVLYELASLHPPHAGRDALEVLEQIRRRAIRPVRSHAPAVPKALARVIHRALEWRAVRRHGSALELASDLEACADGRAPAAGPPEVQGRPEALAQAAPPAYPDRELRYLPCHPNHWGRHPESPGAHSHRRDSSRVPRDWN
jgi:serine/threonine protein kinase